MNGFNILFVFTVALIATACANPAGYSAPGSAADYAQSGSDNAAASANAVAGPADNSYAPVAAPAAQYGPSQSYGNNYNDQQSIPYTPENLRGNSATSSISYPYNKGEILIHRPAAIIVKRPPTKVVVNHPPLVVRPAPVVLHKPPAVVLRKVLVKYHPRPVRVEPVYVNVVKPPAEKYFVNERQQNAIPPTSYSPASAPTYAENNGYTLLQKDDGMAALANLGGSSYANPAPAQYGSAPASAPAY